MRLHVDANRPAPRKLLKAIEALQRDQVIIYPTDTGYAFGCALSSPKGIALLRRLKGLDERDPKPLSMMVHTLAEMGRYGSISNSAFRLLRRLLPGPYTIVLKAASEVPRAMHNRYHEIGIRIPKDALCQLLLELLGEPLLTGSVTRAEDEQFELEEPEVLERKFARELEIVIDGGPLWPEPSTVLRVIDDSIEVLRKGQGELPLELQ